MKAYVTDTHPLVWYTVNSKKLSKKVLKIFKECEAGEALIYIPTPVLWELTLLIRARKFEFNMSLKEWYQNLTRYKTFVVTPFEPEVIIDYHDISLPENNDPFDRIIVASALALDCPLITTDSSIHNSKLVEVIW